MGILISAQVEPEQRRELMQMCKTRLSNQVPVGLLGKTNLRTRHDPNAVLLVEQWFDSETMNSHLSS